MLLHTIDERIYEVINDPDVSIGLAIGGRRKGKSLLSYGVIDELYTMHKMPCYEFGLPKVKEHLLPPHIKPAESLDLIPDGSAFVCDEAYREFYARQSMSDANKFIDTLCALSGQKQLKSIYITQHARRLDRGIVGDVDFILFKKPSLMQMEFDRQQLRKILKKVYSEFMKLKPPTGESLEEYQKRCTYVLSENFVGMIKNSNVPPAWWSEDISKAYAGVPLETQREEIDFTKKQIVTAIAKYIGGKKEHRLTGYESGKYVPKSERQG